MTGKKHVRWLYKELPELVGKGVIGRQNADALRQHYGEVVSVGGRNAALVVFGIIGSLLIGIGVITVLAHNWAELTRPARTFIAIAPLLAAQAFGIHVMRQGKGVAARESAATFISLLFASSVAIVGQTYHIGGDLGGFLLTCAVLIIPLAFMMDAVMPSVFYILAITGWLGFQRSHDGLMHMYWLLLIPVLYRFVCMVRTDKYGGRTVLLSWVLALCLPIAAGILQDYEIGGAWIVIFSSVFGLMYLASVKWFHDAESIWASPFRSIGASGMLVLSFILTYEFCWDNFYYRYRRVDFSSIDAGMFLVLMIPLVILLVTLFRQGRRTELVSGAMPVLAAFSFFAVFLTREELPAMLVFNLYLLVLSVSKIASGLKNESISKLNSGMLMLGLLIMLRFIDAELDFLFKGIVFIFLGAGFLAVNFTVLRKKKEVAK